MSSRSNNAISHVFKTGKHAVRLVHAVPEAPSPPPKPLLIASPLEEGEYSILVLFHGYLLHNSFYSQLSQHVASHGFIVVAPQLYRVAGRDSSEEIKSAAETIDWLSCGLSYQLPEQVLPDLSKIAISGHSRGGKVAFALALGYAKTSLKLSALMGIDPLDGICENKQTNPPILTYVPHSFDINMPALVVGTGLGGVKKNPLFPPCAPKGVNYQEFFKECRSPACLFVAKDYGHLDMLDDETKGLMGKATYCLCKNGEDRKPMRLFVGGVMVAFMNAYLEGNTQDLVNLKENPECAPVELSVIECLE